ncbi:MAG: hypothetical protein AAB770_02325 [Patescibacteria group bacterium]
MDKKIGVIVASSVVVIILALGVFLQQREAGSATEDTNFISKKGLHWHSELFINVNGKEIVAPPNIGLGAKHNPMHTHEEPNVIHMEFPALVRQDDLFLGKFFEIWGKDMRSFGANIRMTVNGVENTEFENYQMKDKDKIILTFE